jgi:hypothetical protein
VVVDRVPVDRVLLVLDDSTDVALLRRVLTDAWSRMDAGSPNRAVEIGALLAVRAPFVGLPTPSQYAGWTERIDRQERAVFQLLLERALPPDRRTPSVWSTRPDPIGRRAGRRPERRRAGQPSRPPLAPSGDTVMGTER